MINFIDAFGSSDEWGLIDKDNLFLGNKFILHIELRNRFLVIDPPALLGWLEVGCGLGMVAVVRVEVILLGGVGSHRYLEGLFFDGVVVLHTGHHEIRTSVPHLIVFLSIRLELEDCL